MNTTQHNPDAARKAHLVVVRASSGGGGDFDDFLIKMSERFDKAQNKPAVIGYSAAAIGAFFAAEWIMHLPLLNALVGFPVQLVGLLALPVLGVRYLVDGGDFGKDLETAASSIVKKLPGLDK